MRTWSSPPSRAYEIIAIADGSKSLEEVNSRGGVTAAERMREVRRKQREAKASTNSGTFRKNPEPTPNGPTSGSEAQSIVNDLSISDIVRRLKQATPSELRLISELINRLERERLVKAAA